MSTEKSKNQKQSSCAETETEKATVAKKRFERDLLIRGEAAKSGKDGELPPGATHRIVENNDEEQPPEIERERFSIY